MPVSTISSFHFSRCESLTGRFSQRNRRFRDTEFDLVDDRDRCLHSLDTEDEKRFNPADVRRVTEIFNNVGVSVTVKLMQLLTTSVFSPSSLLMVLRLEISPREPSETAGC